MSEFEAWFREQHGTRLDSPEFANVSDDELMQMMMKGHRALMELHRREKYEARRTSALWAWQARETTGGQDHEQ